jgi:hypothetical protein
MKTLHVTYYQSLALTKEQDKNLRLVGEKLEQHHQISHISTLLYTLVDDMSKFEVVEKGQGQHIYLMLKANNLPVLHITPWKG